MQNGERALNRSKGSGFAASVWLENDGDSYDQETAANRSDMFSDIMKFTLNNSRIAYVWPKSVPDVDIQNICAQVDILIVPNWSENTTSECKYITKSFLRYQGAVSLILKDQSVYIKTARQITGERLWNTWWLRTRPDKS